MSVTLEGREISVPMVQGNPEVFTHFRFFFVKPKWIPDEACNECPICHQIFTTLKRKHHCRNCGRVLCGKCCNHKVPLPQFALDEPQRTCNSCRDVAELVSRSRSQYISHRQEAAKGLVNMLKNTEDLSKMVACGGMQTILSLASQGDLIIWSAVASATHSLAQHFLLHESLITAGAVQALTYLMEMARNSNEQLLVECLTTFSLFCSNYKLINKVIDLGDLGLVEELLFSPFNAVNLLAARVIYFLVKHLELQTHVLQRSCSLVRNVLKSLKSGNIQMQDQALKILTCLSAGDENVKHKIVLEDEGGTGTFLLPFLKQRSSEEGHILQSALCILGNLAASRTESDMTYLQQYLPPVLDVVKNNRALSVSTLTHLARTLANFADFSINALPLVGSLPVIVETLLHSNSDGIRLHACRLIISLMTTESSATLQSLTVSGADDFVQAIFGIPGVEDILTRAILRNVSKLSLDLP